MYRAIEHGRMMGGWSAPFSHASALCASGGTAGTGTSLPHAS